MSRERTDYERLTDDALLLCLWSLAQKREPASKVGDRIKAMKLAFLVAYPLFRDRVKALNFEFFKWDRGPMAKNLYDSLADFEMYDLAHEDEDIVITDRGLSFGTAFYEEVLKLPENHDILTTVDSVAYEFGPLDQSEVLERVYRMNAYTLQHPSQRRSIKSVPRSETFTKLLEEDEATQSLFVPDGWKATLDLVFHPQALSNLQRAIDDTHEGRLYKGNGFWATV
jgi:hypothetical protein